MGIGEATFYNWNKQYAGMGIVELAELRQLREENTKLKRLAADLPLDKHVLQEIVAKKLQSLVLDGTHPGDLAFVEFGEEFRGDQTVASKTD
jgi:putative transposase